MMEILEEPMQLNLAYGLRGEICRGMDTESTEEEYEYTDHDHFGPTMKEPEKSSNLAVPIENKVPIQQHERDNEYPYEYIL